MLGNALGRSPSSFNLSAAPMEEEDDGETVVGSHDARVDDVTRRQAYCLYVSHALSMWNSRMYEFAVVRYHSTNLPASGKMVLEWY